MEMQFNTISRVFNILMGIKDKCGNDLSVDPSDQNFENYARGVLSDAYRIISKNKIYGEKIHSNLYNNFIDLLESLSDYTSDNIPAIYITIIIDTLLCMYTVNPRMYIFNKLFILLSTFERHDDVQNIIGESIAYILDPLETPLEFTDTYEVPKWLTVILAVYDEDESIFNDIIQKLTNPKYVDIDTIIILISYLISSNQLDINLHDYLLEDLIASAHNYVEIYATVSCGAVISDVDNVIEKLLNTYITLIKCIAKYDYAPKCENSNTIMGLELIVMVHLLHDIAIYTRGKVYKVLKIYNRMNQTHMTYQRHKIKAIIEERFYVPGGPGYALASDTFYNHAKKI